MADRYASLKQGLVGCWIPSVSGSGLLLPDLSGRGNNGSLVGMDASDWVSSQYGRALDFDGVDDRIVASGNTSFTNGVVSVSGWMRRTGAAGVNNAVVFSKGTLEGNANSTCALYWNETLGWSWFIVDAANTLTIVRSNTVTSQSQWVHIAGVASPAGVFLYLNGVLANSTTTAAVKNSTHESFIGGASVGGGTFASLLGQPDDVRAYNRPLTEPEIRLLASEPGIGFKPAKKLSRFSQRFTYNPPKARNYGVTRVKETDYGTLRQSLVGAWCPSLPSGGSGNTLPDQSGYGNHGSLVGMSPDDWVSSQYGRALDFDGVNDRVESRAISYQSLPLTVAAWVKPNTVSGVQMLASHYGAEGNRSWYLALINNAPRILVSPDGTLFPYGQGGTVTTDWTHVVGVVGPSAFQIYLNGIAVSTTLTGTYPTQIFNSTANVVLGDRATIDTPLNGQLNDVRIYNRALTEAEIRLLASRPGIGLRQEIHRNTFYQFPSFQPAIARRSSAIIGGGIT